MFGFRGKGYQQTHPCFERSLKKITYFMSQFRCSQQVAVESNGFPSVGSFTNGSLANIQHFFFYPDV